MMIRDAKQKLSRANEYSSEHTEWYTVHSFYKNDIEGKFDFEKYSLETAVQALIMLNEYLIQMERARSIFGKIGYRSSMSTRDEVERIIADTMSDVRNARAACERWLKESHSRQGRDAGVA